MPDLNINGPTDPGFHIQAPEGWEAMDNDTDAEFLATVDEHLDGVNERPHQRTLIMESDNPNNIPASNEKEDAIAIFLTTFSGTDTFTESTVWESMSCNEAEAFANLLAAHGSTEAATELTTAHRAEDPDACDEFGHRTH